MRSVVALVCLLTANLHGEEFTELRRFDAVEAVQGVAVDSQSFYAIASSSIGKYDKQTGKLQQRWKASDDYPLTHLNSGIIRERKLYCAHSNYPQYPEASSIEIWDTATLKHIGSHSLGIVEGSLTWIDWKDNSWWAVFAHYTNKAKTNPHAKDTRWTTLVRFDNQWRRQAGWVFPPEVVKRFEPYSCSGGAWGPDGALYCTGHDHGEVYRLELPKAGSTLKLTKTLKAPITGQGIAWDKANQTLYGINRPKQKVIVSRIGNKPDSTREPELSPEKLP